MAQAMQGSASLGLLTDLLFAFCVPMRLPQAHPGPTTIPIDEFDAGSFQSTANRQIVGHGIDVSPPASSARLIVASPKAASRASCAALHRRRARAARIWALFNGFGFIVDEVGTYDPRDRSLRISKRHFPEWRNL
jgi:hypothetical protein